MACNKNGRDCQPAGSELGAGDTELVQMVGRRSQGNCPNCGSFLYGANKGGGCPVCEKNGGPPLDLDEEGRHIGTILDKAIANNEQYPFVIVPGGKDYIRCQSPIGAVREARQFNGAAYVYDPDSHPANDPRLPIAVFTDGRLGMYNQKWAWVVKLAVQEDTMMSARSLLLAIKEDPLSMGEIKKCSDTLNCANPAMLDESAATVLRRAQRVVRATSEDEQVTAAQQLYQAARWHDEYQKEVLSVVQAILKGSSDKGWERVEFDHNGVKFVRGGETVGFISPDGQGGTGEASSIKVQSFGQFRVQQIRNEFGADFWGDGYTEEEVNTGCGPLNELAKDTFGLSGDVGVVWSEHSRSGFGGDSDLCYIEAQPDGRVFGYSLPVPYWQGSNSKDLPDALRDISAGKIPPNYTWSSLPRRESYNFAETEIK